ncbi:MAG: choice-of-anchor Q domain-containing protein [Candidatus Eisenbacteria bacterium]|nr:choice-of-anchor Q domain-containing protein [Candidatus Eisenbacteria bacterium]
MIRTLLVTTVTFLLCFSLGWGALVTPMGAKAPCRITCASGTFPPGFARNHSTGSIEGKPTESGILRLTLHLADTRGAGRTTSGKVNVKVGRILTVGEHGTFNGFEGIQMALNAAQDGDEIRVERGVYGGTGLLVPENKVWQHGIRISGGWDETFREATKDAGTTVLQGKGGENRILTISESIHRGKVILENLTFRDGSGGAVKTVSVTPTVFINCSFDYNSVTGSKLDLSTRALAYMQLGSGGAVEGSASFTDCMFWKNSAEHYGGAVDGDGTYANCTFVGNSAGFGGAVSGSGTFTRCVFKNNSASGAKQVEAGTGLGLGEKYVGMGGAAKGDGFFVSCAFARNSADHGGAASGSATFINCTFCDNKAEDKGGGIEGGGSVINSVFYKNVAAAEDNDIAATSNIDIDFCLLNYLAGAADYGHNNIMGDPKFVNAESGDLHLLADSPCINVGSLSPELKKRLGKLLLDLDGKPRVVGGKIDMGAYEWQGQR